METSSVSKQLDWSRASVHKLIDLYEERSLLYDTADPEYKNKQARHRALTEITEKFREKFPFVTVNDIKSKISGIRGQYANELKKKAAQQGGDSSTTPYWYERLDFLRNFMKTKEPRTTFMEISLMDQKTTSFYTEDSFDGMPESKRLKSAERIFLDESVSSETKDNLEDETNSNVNSCNFGFELEAFCEYLKAEISAITDPVRQAVLRQKVINLVFDFKIEEYNQNDDY